MPMLNPQPIDLHFLVIIMDPDATVKWKHRTNPEHVVTLVRFLADQLLP